jgi:hypothetical protein
LHPTPSRAPAIAKALDFNAGALKEQREEHWDGSDEESLCPLPHIDN